MTADPLVRLRGVSKSYDRAGGDASIVLENVDLELAAGEKASLIGPSGSGKSTLMALMAGLLRPDEGTVEIEGRVTSDLRDRERAQIRAERVGIALQSDNLIPFLTAVENVQLARSFSSAGRRSRTRDQAVELLEHSGVAHRAEHLPRQLSGGEAQRVALAVSMANNPAVLLADEVVAQLDADTARDVIDRVLEASFAVLFVTHDVQLADDADTRYELTGRTVRRR